MSLPEAVQRSVARAAKAHADSLAKSAPAAAPAATPKPAAAPAAVDDAEKLKADVARLTAENKTLQGKYNAEVPRFAEQLRESNAKLKAAEDKLAAAAPPKDLSISDADRQKFGTDLIDVIDKVATARAGEIVEGKLKPVTDQFEQFKTMSTGQYLAVIEDAVPDWKEINVDPAFNAWLAQPDPASGKTRHDLLMRGDSLNQGNRVAEIFLAYKEKREIGARQPAGPGPLDTRQDPPPGGGEAPPAGGADEPTGKIWLRSEITAFYRAKREGKYKGKEGEAEARNIELDINAAYKEGRIKA